MTLTSRMLLFFLMLVAVTESKVLQRKEDASQDTSNLKSPNNRDTEQIKQFVEELKGLGGKLNARGVEQVSFVKTSKNAGTLKERNLQQAILSAKNGQSKALDSLAKKLTDVTALTSRGLENGQGMQSDQILKQFGSIESLKARNLKQEFSRLGRNVNQIKQMKENLESLGSVNAWHWIPRDREMKEKMSKDLDKLSSQFRFPWKQGTEIDVKQRDQTVNDLARLSSKFRFPWKQGTEIDLKQRDQTINDLAKLSSDWWFPEKQGSEINLKQREQEQKDLGNLSPDVVWLPWKQGLSKLGRDAEGKGFGTKSLNPFSNGWNWKEEFMPISEKTEKQRDKLVRKGVSLAAEAYKKVILSKAGGKVKKRGAHFSVEKKHVTPGESSAQKRGSIEKVGDCYYVCDDICDPICHTECELVC